MGLRSGLGGRRAGKARNPNRIDKPIGGVLQEIELQNEPSCVSIARTFVSDYLEDLGIPETETFDILLALNEAVANAHRHGRNSGHGRIRVQCAFDDGIVRFRVRDDGGGFEFRPEMAEMPDPLQASGRGLYLMSELMDHMAIRSSGDGTTVELERRAPASVSC